jgi:outer membrane lipoprotein-sorting protein
MAEEEDTRVMKRNLALSILFLPLAAVIGLAQATPAGSVDSTVRQTTSPQQPATKTEQPSSAQEPQAAPAEKSASAKPAQSPAPAANSNNDLSAVLAKMNQSSMRFKAAAGDFEFQSYQELVKETDTQRGQIYFRHRNKGVDAAFKIEGAAPKQVVYKDGELLVYEEKIKQITKRNVGSNKTDVEAFLSLGFGASGDDLLQSYAVKMDGWETVDGVKTAKLELTPKNEKMRQTYNKIVLWIDPERDVLLQQKFFESSGDYRLAHYTHMKLTDKISDDKFQLKTTGKVTTVQPQ